MEKTKKQNDREELETKELDLDALEQVTGSGDPFQDPFQDIPRVPEEPIDDDDRKDI